MNVLQSDPTQRTLLLAIARLLVPVLVAMSDVVVIKLPCMMRASVAKVFTEAHVSAVCVVSVDWAIDERKIEVVGASCRRCRYAEYSSLSPRRPLGATLIVFQTGTTMNELWS